VALVQADVPEEYRTLVEELAVAPIPERPDRQIESYLRSIVGDLVQRHLRRRKEELIARLQRTDAVADPTGYREIQVLLVQLEADRRAFQAE
jgi:DNA primase